MPNRHIEDANGYRYGYQGQFAEEDNETRLNAFELRMYDSRIGRWISPDPYGQFHSPYIGMSNNPISYADPDGGCTVGVDCPTEFDWMGEGTWVMDEVVLGSNGDFSTGVLWGSDSIGVGGLFDFSLQNQTFWEGIYSNQDWRSNMLTFDGKDLMIDYDPPSEDIWRSVHIIPATSGKGEFMNDPSAQNRQDLGPIPEGIYAFSNTSWDKLSTIRQYYNIVRGNGDWGRYNAPLIPLSYNGARHSFYIHGGYFEGSAGCIDCGGNISTVHDITKNWNYTLLRVKYD